MIVWGDLTNSCEQKRSEEQRRKERYTHLNAEFQRIAKRDKAFLSGQCKEIEENNRMGKTRDLFKKIRDIKGTFHAKMGSIKVRNGMDLTEAEDIKKGDKNTQENCTKKSYDQPRQHIKKQRHYFVNKGPSSQGYGFSTSDVWMWELD